MRRNFQLVVLMILIFLNGCTSVGNVGIITRPSSDAAALLRSGRAFQEIGPAQGKACRYFLLAVIPWGDSAFSTAVERALSERGGDALINVTTTSSLYGFIPIYNIFSFTCNSVEGIAIKFQ